ncbi:MAG: SBBP repeat-containing protein [Ignavibacterium sp.]
MKNIFFLLLAFQFYCGINAQVDTSWIRRFGGSANGDDFVTAMVIDKIGNVYITGSCIDVDGESIATVKYTTSGETSWVAKFHPSIYGNRKAYGIAIDDSFNVYVTGYSSSLSNPSTFVTIKYDSAGQEKWFKYFGPHQGEARAITLDKQGNIYVTGFATIDILGFDFVTIKYNSCGDQLWFTRYTNTVYGYDLPKSIAVDDSGNVYVTGTSYDSTTFYDILTVKYNSDGQQQWVRRYDDPGLAGSHDDCAYAIALDRQGDILITGGIQGIGNLGLPPEGYLDCITIKYNWNGDTIWLRKYDSGRGYDWGKDLIVDSLNNIYITGTGRGISSPDYLTLKYSPDGQLIWDKYYNGPNYASEDDANSITIDKLGNIYVSGQSKGNNFHDDYATVKYNPNGDEQWSIRYDGPINGIDRAIAVRVDDQFNVIVTGQSKGSNFYYDFLTIKYAQVFPTTTILISNAVSGSQILNVLSNDGFAVGDSILINPGGSNEELNKITGFGSIQLQTPLQFDHFIGEQVVKFSIISVENDFEKVPLIFELYQNYPNPFNPSTRISWQSPVGSWQTLKIYDVLGNEIATLVDEYKPAGSYEVEFSVAQVSGPELASGIYFYQLLVSAFQSKDGKAGDLSTGSGQIFIQTKKMILLR